MTASALKTLRAAGKTALPANPPIKVRRPEFEYGDDVPEYWYANDPLRTLLLASMSGGFPEGERFFIDSVRHFQDQVKDPELRQQIRGFIGQEAHHGKQHDLLNAFLEQRGYPISGIDKRVGKLMNWFRKNLSPERQLAHTAAIEHFTAMLAEQYLLDPEELAKLHPKMAGIIAWHSVEEAEHKAVAFDVYKTVVDDEWIRLSQMAFGSFMFMTFSTIELLALLRQSGHLTDWKMWAKGMNHFWGKPGVFRKMLPAYFSYYRRDFHPNEYDSSAKQEAVKKAYLGEFA
jgi:predicted metal-dependent hydrolase